MTSSIENVDKSKKRGGALNEFFMRMGILGELMAFLWRRKLYWLIPMFIALLVFAVIIILGGSSPPGAFIYPIF